MNVYKKLSKARVMLQAKDMKKSGNNKFAGYSYFELGDFLPLINGIFDELGLCGVVSFSKEEATLKIYDTDADSEPIVFTTPSADAPLKGCLPIQCLGAQETYLRRYLWVAAMEIVEHDAVDAAEPQKSPKPGKILPTDGARDEVPKERLEVLERMVQDITTLYVDGDIPSMFSMYQSLPNNEEKTALWTYLGSKERAAIKKYGQELKEQQNG